MTFCEVSASGQKQTYASQKGVSALPPDSDPKSGYPQTVMSALHLKADVCGANRRFCFGPEADILPSSQRLSLKLLRRSKYPCAPIRFRYTTTPHDRLDWVLTAPCTGVFCTARLQVEVRHHHPQSIGNCQNKDVHQNDHSKARLFHFSARDTKLEWPAASYRIVPSILQTNAWL